MLQSKKSELKEDSQELVIKTDLSKEAFQTVFRYLFSKENSLIELFPNSIIVNIKDLEDLNRQINQKLAQYDVLGITFDAVASYENKKSEQYSSWDKFFNDDWSTPNVLDQLLLNWRFMIKFPKIDKPTSYVVSVRLASALKPQHLIQAIFSKDPEDIDKIEMELVPMCCRVDFVDPMLSQELMNIVSDWNKGRPSPEYVFPIIKKIKKHSELIGFILRYSIPILSIVACIIYYWNKTHNLDLSLPATTSLIVSSILWLVTTSTVLFITAGIGYLISVYIRRQLYSFGRFTIFNLTKGDNKRQADLEAKSKNSFWKFLISGCFAILWNIVAAIVCI